MLQVSVIVNVYVNIIYFNELFKVNVNVIVNVNVLMLTLYTGNHKLLQNV